MNDYVYDDAGRLTKVQLAAGRTAYYAYDDAGLMTRKALPDNKVFSYYRYDDAGRLEQLENRGTVYSNLVSYFRYARNANGAIENVTHQGGEATYYTYDELDRFTGEARKSGATTLYGFTYSYDATSNRLTKTDTVNAVATYYGYDSRNLLQFEHTVGGTPDYFAYDKSQRMTRKYDPNDAVYFSYNPRDMVTGIDFVNSESESNTDRPRVFDYTGTGERVFVIDDSSETPTYWAYDGSKLLSEKDDTGSYLRKYRHNISASEPMGSVLEIHSGGDRYYPSMDVRGSVTELNDTSSEIPVGKYLYDAFGLGLAESIQAVQRLRFLTSMFIGGATDTLEFYYSRSAIYLTPLARFAVQQPSSPGLSAEPLLLLGAPRHYMAVRGHELAFALPRAGGGPPPRPIAKDATGLAFPPRPVCEPSEWFEERHEVEILNRRWDPEVDKCFFDALEVFWDQIQLLPPSSGWIGVQERIVSADCQRACRRGLGHLTVLAETPEDSLVIHVNCHGERKAYTIRFRDRFVTEDGRCFPR